MQLAYEYGMGKTRVFYELTRLSEALDDSLSQALWDFDDEQLEATLRGIETIDMIAGAQVSGEDETPRVN